MRNKILITVLCVVMSFLNLHAQFTNYITLDCKTFKDGSEDFYPMIVNYEITLHNDNGYYVTPRVGYHPQYSSNASPNDQTPWGNTLTSGLEAIEAHFHLIDSMGFNTIRLTGFGAIKRSSSTLGSWFISDTYSTSFVQNTLAPLIEEVLDLADEVGLRVILLTGANQCESVNNNQTYTDFLATLTNELALRKTILAYDFYNEPIYEDATDYTKQQTKSFVEDWYNAVKDNAPSHLTTIGLAGFKDVEEWDSDLMKVDFISFHVYPSVVTGDDAYKRFDTHLYWISETINTPWIIGEMGFSAGYPQENPANGVCSNADGTYSEQLTFIDNTLDKTKDAGGSGYSWWNFQDERRGGWTSLDCVTGETDYWGLIDHTENNNISLTIGTTTYLIPGALKNTISSLPFSSFLSSPYNTGSSFSMPTPSASSYFTYYNYYGRATSGNVTGYVYNMFGEPIENAIVYIETPYGVPNPTSPASTYLTFSKSDGSFDLKTHYTNVFNYNLDLVVTAPKCKNYVMSVYQLSGPSVGNITLEYVTTNEGTISISNGTDKEYTDLAVQELDNVTLNSGSTSKFIAEKQIHIKAGFKAYDGSQSHLYIDDLHCPTNSFSDYLGIMPGQRIQHNEEIEIINDSKIEELSFIIYPNPSNGIFNVEVKEFDENKIYKVEVYNIQGVKIYEAYQVQKKIMLDLSMDENGIYIVRLISDKDVYNKKIIKS